MAIGQKGSTIASVKGALGGIRRPRVHDHRRRAPASDPAGLQVPGSRTPVRPSASTGCTGGKHVLIVFDDLSKQAEAYRAVSLLAASSPRAARPTPVTSSTCTPACLERCAKLSDEMGGGSMTGLPIIETKANDVSAFIPTNVISITDGQCFLESDLFNSGVRPAINVGISVSRVGGSAQPKAMKKVAGQLRLNLAQFRELEAFAAFGSDLDAASKAQLGRGSRLVELLKQAQYEPQAMEREVISVWAGTTGRLDDVPVEDIRRFDAEFLDYVERTKTEILDAIRSTSDLSDDTVSVLESTIEEFKRQFSTSSGQLLVNDEPVEALEDEDIDPTQITRSVRG